MWSCSVCTGQMAELALCRHAAHTWGKEGKHAGCQAHSAKRNFTGTWTAFSQRHNRPNIKTEQQCSLTTTLWVIKLWWTGGKKSSKTVFCLKSSPLVSALLSLPACQRYFRTKWIKLAESQQRKQQKPLPFNVSNISSCFNVSQTWALIWWINSCRKHNSGRSVLLRTRTKRREKKSAHWLFLTSTVWATFLFSPRKGFRRSEVMEVLEEWTLAWLYH